MEQNFLEDSTSYRKIMDAHSYPRSGCNLFNFYAEDKGLRLWILEEISKRSVSCKEQGVALFHNIHVTPDGSLLQHGTRLLEIAKIDRRRDMEINNWETPRHASTGRSNSVYIFKEGFNNYGHFLVEMAPKIILATEYLGGTHINFVAPNLNQSVRYVFEKISKILCPDCTFEYVEKPTVFSEIFIPSPVSIHNTQKSITLRLLKDRLLEKIPLPSSPTTNNIYVKRKLTDKRVLINEKQIDDALTALGFSPIYPEDYTIEEQISIFSNARVVIGAMGAAMTNIMFCKPETRIILIDPASYDFFFMDLAALFDLRFNWFFTKKISFKDDTILFQKFTVDVKSLISCVNLVLDD